MNLKKLQFEAVRLLTKIQTECSKLFSELQDEHHVVELEKETFALTEGEMITAIFLSDEKKLMLQTEIKRDGEAWEYDFILTADIGDSLSLLKSLESIKLNRILSAN